MAVLAVLVLVLSLVGGSSGAQWCVCRSDVSDQVLQKALDYACGAGADCSPILQSGACFQPNTVRAHCSYATNSYYQRKGQVTGSCDFSNTATVVTTDPSTGGSCSYPSSASSTTPTTGAPGTSITNPNNPATSTTPGTFTPIGGGGGINSGLGPTGINTDPNAAFPAKADKGLLFLALLFSGIFYLRAL